MFAVAISMISMPRLVFTLIQRLHHSLREACIDDISGEPNNIEVTETIDDRNNTKTQPLEHII